MDRRVSKHYLPVVLRTRAVIIPNFQLKKSWKETEATSSRRYYGENWSEHYLDLKGNDAGPDVIGTTTVYTNRPAGFVEFDVTNAVRNWANGNSNYGVLLRATTEYTEGRGIRFFSKSHSDSSRHAFINVLCEYIENISHASNLEKDRHTYTPINTDILKYHNLWLYF